MLLTRFIAGLSAASLMLFGMSASYGQEYPSKVIHIIGGSAGGGNDNAARIIANGITQPLGQPVVIDNKAGGSVVSVEALTTSAPDGYTLLVIGSAVWIIPLI